MNNLLLLVSSVKNATLEQPSKGNSWLVTKPMSVSLLNSTKPANYSFIDKS